MTIRLQLISFAIAVILTLGIASAQTLVAGKVYNSDYSNVIDGVSVTAQCAGNKLTTVSLNDGTYAVRFDNSQCTLGNGVSVYASKGSLSGSESGVVIECAGDCSDEYSTIINMAIKNTGSGSSGGSSGGGGSVRVYICGNGKCDSGETAITCARDCAVTNNTNITSNENNQTEPINLEGNNTISFGITGASVSLWDKLSLPFLVSLLAFLIILLIGHKAIQSRKKKTLF